MEEYVHQQYLHSISAWSQNFRTVSKIRLCGNCVFHSKLVDYRENGFKYERKILILQDKVKAAKNQSENSKGKGRTDKLKDRNYVNSTHYR